MNIIDSMVFGVLGQNFDLALWPGPQKVQFWEISGSP